MKFFATLLLLALLCAAFVGYTLDVPIGPPSGTPDTSSTYVDIAPGTGTQAIAEKLEQAHVLRSRYAFDLLRLLKGGKLIAGEYRFNHPATAAEVYDRMAHGDTYSIALTIPEGYNIFDIAQAVASTGFASRDTFLAAERTQTSLIADLAPHAPSLEGYLFPDTYRLPRTATPTTILAAMVHRFRQVSAQLGLPADPTSNRTVILASLIEKEVSQPSERPLVAGVFTNRLAQNIPLATDPSIVYSALLNNRYRGTIYASDLQADSPYNTYRRPGLPPGPIANPGVAALKAAISPAPTDYLYFVADAQGHSQFSATLKEHAAQVQIYRKAIGEPTSPPKPHSPQRPPSASHRRKK
ncbi:MAG TPA: endolytic transglycosylase MltG [Acidobacteriaceae bacterium]|nr:endolytic transglycosylase MltG [Acidobacteriaceae bacterium]